MHIGCECIFNNEPILERNGIPDDVREITEDIMELIDNNELNIDIRYSNMFINHIILNVIYDANRLLAEYEYEKTDYINKEIYMNIYANIKNQNIYDTQFFPIKKLIQHELVHAYEDISRYNNGCKVFSEIIKSEYNIFAYIVSNPSKQKQYNDIANAIYFLNDQERNAYLSELELDIKKIIKDNHIRYDNFDYNKIIDNLNNNNWKRYIDIGKLIYMLNDNNNEYKWYRDMICRAYRKICNNANMSDNSIRKLLTNKWNKFDNKFKRYIAKIIYENLEHTIR